MLRTSGILLCIVAPLAAQVAVGDVAVSRFSGTTFTILAGATPTSYPTGGFLGTGTSFSHAILRDVAAPNSFLIGGDGFVGRATVLGAGSVSYSLITNNVGFVVQMSWNDAGLVVFADAGTSQVRLLDPQSGAVADLSSGPQPWGNDLSAGAWDPATGDVVLGGSGALYRLANGAATATPFVSGLGGFVSGVAFDPVTGEVAATVLTVNRLVRVSPAAVVSDIAPSGSLPGPNALDVDQNGDFVTGGGVGQIHRVPRTGGSPVQLGSAGGPVTGVCVAGSGGYGVPFGNACNGVAGPAVLSATGPFQVGATVTMTSINHAPTSLGAVILGLSRTTHLALPLPLLLDPVLGTSGCYANVSLDVALPVLTDVGSPASLTFSLALPPGFAGHDFFVQHACFEPVPGGMSWSNGLAFRVP